MFNPDKPIESVKEDLLDRASFAQSFGQALLAHKDKASIVTALYGDWGTGKSSVINMAIESIKESTKDLYKDKKPIIVRFNPWNYSDQNQLVSQFFKELSFSLRRDDYGVQAKDIGEKLEVYASFFAPLALIPEPTVSAPSFIIKNTLKTIGHAAKKWGQQHSQDLTGTRNKINELLDKQNRKLLIVIDDIDRLNSVEIRQIFQLVKMLGDFPNTVYLLAFGRGIVIKALEKVQEGPGEDYLEKIVQVAVELPQISKSDVEKLLFSSIDNLIKEVPEEYWDKTYWGNIYNSGLRHFFNTLRDVSRYINALEFSYEMVKDDVNPIDFLAITAIQVFEPDLYYGIRDNKNIFTGVFGDSFGNEDIEIKQAKNRCDEIKNRIAVLTREQINDFLPRLFPKLEAIYSNMHYGGDSLEDWRRNGRVCSPDAFEIYFRLAIPKSEIPNSEMKAILQLAEDQSTFKKALQKLNEDGKIIIFLDRMEDYTKDLIPEANIQNIITVLMDIGDTFPESTGGMYDFGTHVKFMRIGYQLSHRFEEQEKRFNILHSAIESAENSIYTIIHEVVSQGKQHGKLSKSSEPEEKRTVNSKQLGELEKLAIVKIEKWAKEKPLSKSSHLASILYSWKRLTEPSSQPVKEYTNKLIESDEGIVDLIAAFLSKSTSHGLRDYVGRVQWRIRLESIEDFVPPKDIEPRVRIIVKSEDFKMLGEKQQKALQIFLDTYDGKVDDRY